MSQFGLIILQDLGEFGIAPKVIATKENFASNEQEWKRKAVLSSSLVGESTISAAESVLVDLVQPKKYTVCFLYHKCDSDRDKNFKLKI